MLPTPKACCVVILVCRRFYRFVSTTNTAAGVNFPNRISFIGIQNGRRIVYLDDGGSSRVDECEALSQSIRFVWPHYGPYMWIQTLKSHLEVQRTRLQSGCKVVVVPKEIPIIEESQPVNVLERRYLYTGEQRRS